MTAWADATLERFKAWLGDTSATDAQLKLALDTALATAENYCQRGFEKRDVVGELFAPARPWSHTWRWPLDTIAAVRFEDQPLTVDNYRADMERGRLYVAGAWSGELAIDYTGGLDPAAFPPDLELALWSIAAPMVAAWQSVAGAPIAGGAGTKRISQPDLGTIEFFEGGAGGGGAGGSASAFSPAIEALLNPYRSAAGVGVG